MSLEIKNITVADIKLQHDFRGNRYAIATRLCSPEYSTFDKSFMVAGDKLKPLVERIECILTEVLCMKPYERKARYKI